mmetsp:Transcript_4243/g.6553  ORF Transcript_4243/g.6553 Transcript_4243/m.6553 type:complete len:578 (-) Transcript_4243:182-1915(-)
MNSFLQTFLGNPCAATSPQPVSFNCADGEIENYHPSQRPTLVLQNHEPDAPMRWVIDQADVKSAIQYQGEEAMRQQQRQTAAAAVSRKHSSLSHHRMMAPSKSKSKEDDNSTVNGTESSCPSSILAKTEITTDTQATPIVTNLEQYVKKNHKSKLDQFKILEGVMEEEEEENDIREGKYKKTSTSSPTSAATGCIIGNPLSVVSEMNRRNHFTKALHLKVKANMGKFFWLQYVKAFPLSPVPEFVAYSTTNKGPERITRSWNDAPDYQQNINNDTLIPTTIHFGNPVHSEPITMMVDDINHPNDHNSPSNHTNAFLDLGVTGSLGLVKRFEVNPETGQRLKCPNHYKVVLNRRSGVPLAVCALKSLNGPPVVRIFTVKPHYPGQTSAATTDQIGIHWLCSSSASYPLYAWAEFVAEGEFPNPVRYSLYMCTGVKADGRALFEAKPSYRAVHRTIGSPELLVMGKTQHELELTGAAVISFQFNEEEDYFCISVARGIDPALMICLAGIVDETMERSMRRKLEVTQSHLYDGHGEVIPKTPERHSMEQEAMAKFTAGMSPPPTTPSPTKSKKKKKERSM